MLGDRPASKSEMHSNARVAPREARREQPARTGSACEGERGGAATHTHVVSWGSNAAGVGAWWVPTRRVRQARGKPHLHRIPACCKLHGENVSPTVHVHLHRTRYGTGAGTGAGAGVPVLAGT